jgi:hypothetical protein
MRLKGKVLGRCRDAETFPHTKNDLSVSTKWKRI